MVYVEDPALVTDAKLLADGPNYKLSLKTQDVYGLKMKDVYQTPVWSSKKNEIAFVDENGLVYARKAGKTVISTKINGKNVRINVIVN